MAAGWQFYETEKLYNCFIASGNPRHLHIKLLAKRSHTWVMFVSPHRKMFVSHTERCLSPTQKDVRLQHRKVFVSNTESRKLLLVSPNQILGSSWFKNVLEYSSFINLFIFQCFCVQKFLSWCPSTWALFPENFTKNLTIKTH